MNRRRLLAAMALLQIPVCLISAQTCPTSETYLTLSKSGEADLSGFYVKFDMCDLQYGPSNSSGVIKYGPAEGTPSTEVSFSKGLAAFRARTLRNASFMAPEAPILTVVVKNDDGDAVNKNAILSFFRSATGAAVLVALITGLFGTLITHLLQTRKFRHDLELQEQYKRAEESRTRLSKDLDNERDFVRSAYELVGRCIAAGDDLLAIATPEFQSKTPGPSLLAAREKLRLSFDGTEAIWKAERYSTDLLIKLYHAGHNQIQQIWGEIDSAIAAYFDICKQKYHENLMSGAVVAGEQKAAIRKDHVERIVAALRLLTVEIATARQSSDNDIEAATL